jgi:hypothetical protein
MSMNIEVRASQQKLKVHAPAALPALSARVLTLATACPSLAA